MSKLLYQLTKMNKNGTVENIHANILQKIKIIGKTIAVIDRSNYMKKMNIITETRYEYVKEMYKHIEAEYEIGTVGILSDYYGDECKSVITEYNVHISERNYVGLIKQCINFINGMKEHMEKNVHYKKDAKKIGNCIKKSNMYVMSIGVKKIDYKTCDCGSVMKIYPSNSELVCPSCGYVMTMFGTVFEDTQFYNQEGQRSKHGSYETLRHCKFWVCRIQARENTEIKENCILQTTDCIKRDGITDRRRLLCAQLRFYLKETKFTEYNDHIPLIRKIITGVAPPQLTEDELRILYNYFVKAVIAYEKIKPADKSNTMYYPYIIYKILNQILKNDIRKRKILECIHLQSRDTLIANDNLWEKICELVGGLCYQPTDKNDQRIYY
jgi:hypothetical protein